jgi:acetate kinase
MTEAGEKDLILVLNSGSSSLKFGIYRHSTNEKDDDQDQDEYALLTGSAEGIGRSSGALQIRLADGKSILEHDHVCESQSHALTALFKAMQEHLRALPTAVGHRIVHGGPNLVEHQRITPELLKELRASVHFAPLHIPPALKLIETSQSIFPDAAQFACFDDAFHQTMPEVAFHFPIPTEYLEAGIRRYGFHGISYESLVHHFGAKLPPRAIFAHLGNGSSLCALRNGKSIDTTMGLTPTGGVPMGTRCGDLDPGILIYLMRHEKLGADQMANKLEETLNRRSGLFALSNGESDVKALQDRAQANDPSAVLALDIFAISVRKAIGAYIALLGGIDLLVFTGGIGEHSERIRSAATGGLESLGLTKDKIQVVATQEERQIARHCRTLMKGNG